MVLRVAKVDEVLVLTEDVAHALRVMKLRLVVLSINKANFAVSNLILKLHGIFIDDDYAVVGRVCDDNEITIETSLLLNADYFAGVTEVLTSGGSLFGRLADCLILPLGFDSICFLFFWPPANRASMVQLFVVEVIGNR